ncbi:MAG: glucodextranase DOMON-like domain-containing protein [Fusobacteriota bacterium]
MKVNVKVKMKRKLMLVIMLVLLVNFFGCFSDKEDEDVEKGENFTLMFEKEDSKGDDNGPGNFTYPTDSAFVENGFDLEKISIEDGEENYQISITIGTNFKNEWDSPNGWDIQLFDVYLNTGEGKNKHTISGRNLKISTGWDKSIMISPNDASVHPTTLEKTPISDVIEEKNTSVVDDETPSENIVDDIFVPHSYRIDGKTIKVKISKSLVGDLSNIKSIQCFVLGAEAHPALEDTLNRNVMETASQWRFGVGTSYEGAPKVIDILGDNTKLGDFNETNQNTVFPTVDMIEK